MTDLYTMITKEIETKKELVRQNEIQKTNR